MPKKKKTQQKNNNNTIDAKLPVIKKGECMLLSNIDGNYIVSEINKNSLDSQFADFVNLASNQNRKMNELYDQLLDKESNTYITTSSELSNLAKNTQNDIDKVFKINGLVKYNINKDDLIGKTVEIIENNINTKFKVNYPVVKIDKKSKKQESKLKQDLKLVIDNFNEQIDIEKLIINSVMTTYTEGNYVFYKKGNKDKGYGIVKYPLKVIEITDRNVNGEPLVVFNVQELKTKLTTSMKKYGKMKYKQKVNIDLAIDKEIKRDYPDEVYQAYKLGDRYVYLNPKNIGVVRINNFGKPYGVTPMFKALPPLLTLETIDNVDRKNLNAKAKKVFFQKMRKEMISQDGKSFDLNAVGYSQASLLKAMSDDVVIYTGTPFVENLEILEPKTDLTSNETVLSNRNRVLNALGISFITNESKSGVNTVKLSYEDLLKSINKITKQLEPIINKFYKDVCIENGYPVEYSPKIEIQSTLLLDYETRLRLFDALYSKIGASYKTSFELLDINFDEELERRKYENEIDNGDGTKGLDNVFVSHPTSFTISGKEDNIITKDNNGEKNSNGSEKSKDQDKAIIDKQNKDKAVKV